MAKSKPIPVRLTERGEQAIFAAWADTVAPLRWPRWLWWHTPNEGARDPRSGAALKRAGMKRGVPDCIIPVAVMETSKSPGYFGLAIELKVKGGRVSPEQAEWLQRLNEAGWLARVCYSGAEAIDLATSYMEGRV